MLTQIRRLANKLSPRLLEILSFAAYPELSGQEDQIAVYVAEVLSPCGLLVRELVGKTGVVGDFGRVDAGGR